MKTTNGRAILKLLFSPTFIYLAVWGFILFLYSLKIVTFPDLSKGFYIVMFMNVLGLILGTLQAKLFTYKFSQSQIVENTTAFFKQLFDSKNRIYRVYKLLIFISFIGILITYFKIFSQVSVMQFFFQQQYIKAQVARSVFGNYLSMASYIALPISACLDFIYSKKLKYSIKPFIFASMYSLSYWGRFPLLMAVIILLSSKLLFIILKRQEKDFLRYKKGILPKIIIYGIIAFILVFLFMSWTIELRVSEYGSGYDPYASYYSENIVTKILEPNAHLFGSFRAITLTYGYFVASVPTLSYWAGMESEYALGQASFPYIFRILDKLGTINGSLIVGDRVIGRGMQLPSFVGYLYIDFGWIGVLVLSYLLGLIATLLFERFLNKPKISNLFFLTLIYALIVFSPMTNIISQTMFVIILFGYFLISFYLKRKIQYKANDSRALS